MRKVLKRTRILFALLSLVLGFMFLLPEAPVLAEETPQETPVEPEEEIVPERVLFVGDSRAVDMFSTKTGCINGKKKNGIKVYAQDGAGFAFLEQSVNKCKLKNFDTLVVWMGTNDSGDFSRYKAYYNKLVKKKKKVILCNVGPIKDSLLSDFWRPYFSNTRTACQYNSSLKKWAKKKNVTVIQTYNFIKKNKVKFASDGIHYKGSSSKKIWAFIQEQLQAAGVNWET